MLRLRPSFAKREARPSLSMTRCSVFEAICRFLPPGANQDASSLAGGCDRPGRGPTKSKRRRRWRIRAEATLRCFVESVRTMNWPRRQRRQSSREICGYAGSAANNWTKTGRRVIALCANRIRLKNAPMESRAAAQFCYLCCWFAGRALGRRLTRGRGDLPGWFRAESRDRLR